MTMVKASVAAGLMICGAGVATAEVWRTLSGAEIAEVLTGSTVIYERASQQFYASGRTLYIIGEESWGYWRVEGDQYCSQWPPNATWACFDLEQAGDRVRFSGAGDDVTTGELTAP